MARRKAHRLDREEHRPAPIPGAAPAVQSVPPSQLQLLHSTIGNRAVQRILEKPPTARPPRIQRSLFDALQDLWTQATGSGSASSTGPAPAPATTSGASGGSGEVATVTDADARLRTDPPNLKNTGATLPSGVQVKILGSATKEGLRYVHVSQVLADDQYGPPLSGWTRRSNLDLRNASADIAPQKPETTTGDAGNVADIPGISATPNIDHPTFLQIIQLLEAMESSPVPIEKTHKEEVGDARRERVTKIAEVRALITTLNPDMLNVTEDVYKSATAYLYKRLAPLTPYYNQIANTNLLGKGGTKGWMRTCNITVPAMVIEGLGKSRADYDGRWGDTALLQKVFDALEGKYLARAQYEAAADFEALRLPDYIALLGIARKLPQDAAEMDANKFDAAVSKAREKAAAVTTAHSTITDILVAFGTQPVQGWISTGKLETIGSARAAYTRILLGAGNKDREAKKAKYEALDADSVLSVSSYKSSVLKQIRPLLDSGAQIMVGMENHFVKLESLDADVVKIDDPGYGTLKNARLTWQQARDFGMFKTFWSVTA
jgi:hypothetical protein